MNNKIAVVDFGGQYAHLIANRIRRQGVYGEVIPSTASLEVASRFKGIILSGGPSSVYSGEAPEFNADMLKVKVPVLGICYGHQLLTESYGGKVKQGEVHEFGPAYLQANTQHPLFKGLSAQSKMWMSHGDEVAHLPDGFKIIGSTKECRHAAVANDKEQRFGIQFHPEVTHSEEGMKVLDNFINLCGAERDWDMTTYTAQLKKKLLKQCEGKNVFLLVSGGVDSTVAFALLNQVLGADRVRGLHIDNGLMRLNESTEIMEFLKKEGFNNLTLSEAQDLFLSRLKGVTAPEAKRKIIGDTFLDVLNKEVSSYDMDPDTWLLAQGTTYPDTIESGGTKNAATIKTHHNRVPAALELLEKGLIIEPLAELYKDEVREMGENLGIPYDLVWRHPFPGPGLGVRLLCKGKEDIGIEKEAQKSLQVLLNSKGIQGEIVPLKSVGVQGDARTYAHPCLLKKNRDWQVCDDLAIEITNQIRDINRVVLEIATEGEEYLSIEADCSEERVHLLQKVDAICTETLRRENLYKTIWQMPVVLLPLTVNNKPVIVLRPIESAEAMTANFTRIDFSILDALWEKIKGMGIGALWYDVTHKPPGTIEWE